MKNTTKRLLGLVGLGFGVVLLSGCTANFCSNVDQAQMAYPYEQGVTVYCNKTAVPSAYTAVATPALVGNDVIYKYVPYTVDATDGSISYTAKKASSYFQGDIIANAKSSGYRVPSIEYWATIDDYVLKAAVTQAAGITYTEPSSFNLVSADFISKITVGDVSNGQWCINPYEEPDTDGLDAKIIPIVAAGASTGNSILRKYGEMKFSGSPSPADGKDAYSLWGFWDAWTQELKFSSDPHLGLDGCPNADFTSYYKNKVASKVNAIRSCIATRTDEFGHFGVQNDWKVAIEQKDWGYAWHKGFLEGLLVYPVSWMVDTFAYGMDPALSGVGQIWAIVLVTLIVRGVLMLLTFKSTLDQQKMQALQPQLAKLQSKYPNSNTNTAEKQRLAQEQMAMYKRNKINPMSQFIVLIFQFPIFICVWSALQGSAALSSGEFINVRLSDTIKDILFNVSGTWYLNTSGWWTALVLFILMAGTQFLAMLLPQLITKIRTKKAVTNLTKNPAQDKNTKQMKWITYGMLAFTVIMGFFLPAAMGVYWLVGAVISMIQTAITQIIMAHQAKKRGI